MIVPGWPDWRFESVERPSLLLVTSIMGYFEVIIRGKDEVRLDGPESHDCVFTIGRAIKKEDAIQQAREWFDSMIEQTNESWLRPMAGHEQEYCAVCAEKAGWLGKDKKSGLYYCLDHFKEKAWPVMIADTEARIAAREANKALTGTTTQA